MCKVSCSVLSVPLILLLLIRWRSYLTIYVRITFAVHSRVDIKKSIHFCKNILRLGSFFRHIYICTCTFVFDSKPFTSFINPLMPFFNPRSRSFCSIKKHCRIFVRVRGVFNFLEWHLGTGKHRDVMSLRVETLTKFKYSGNCDARRDGINDLTLPLFKQTFILFYKL